MVQPGPSRSGSRSKIPVAEAAPRADELMQPLAQLRHIEHAAVAHSLPPTMTNPLAHRCEKPPAAWPTSTR